MHTQDVMVLHITALRLRGHLIGADTTEACARSGDLWGCWLHQLRVPSAS